MADGDVLRIEPGAAERIARAFDTHAKNLAEIALKLRNQAYSTGFAGFPSAVELDAGFLGKRDQAVAHLQDQVEMTLGMAASVRAAGIAYAASDAGAEASIRSVGTDHNEESPPG